MTLDARLAKLQERHATLEQEIEQAIQHPSFDTLQIQEMKRKKLQIKEEIELIKTQS